MTLYRPLKVGDLCATVNTRTPAMNDGVLVVIVGAVHGRRDRRSELIPFDIRRVDGQPFGCTAGSDGVLKFYKSGIAQCAGSKLKRIRPDGVDPRDQIASKGRKTRRPKEKACA